MAAINAMIFIFLVGDYHSSEACPFILFIHTITGIYPNECFGFLYLYKEENGLKKERLELTTRTKALYALGKRLELFLLSFAPNSRAKIACTSLIEAVTVFCWRFLIYGQLVWRQLVA
jgi:hypothetical protein